MDGKPTVERAAGRLERVKSVDGLRGILALIIALFHFGQQYGMGNTFHRGWFAVEVFFLISGFLLADKLENSGGRISLIREMRQRLCRQYPIYAISIVMLVMLYAAAWFRWDPVAWMRSDGMHARSLAAELLCLQTTGLGGFAYVNGPVWYVSALLLSTAIILSLYKVLPRKLFKGTIVFATAVIYAAFFVLDPSLSTTSFLAGTWLPSPLLRGIAGMGAGCCLYWVYLRFREEAKQWRYLNIIAVELCVVTVFHMIWTEPGRSNFLLLIPASIVILAMFWLGGEAKFPILDSRPVQYLGKISYTFFVLQSFSQNVILIYVSGHMSNHYLLNLAYVGLNLLLSAALYPVFERWVPQKLLKLSGAGKSGAASSLASHSAGQMPEQTAQEKAEEQTKTPEQGGIGRPTKRLLPCAVVACFVAFVLWGACAKDTAPTHVLITAVQGTGNVTFRGGEVDGVWYSPADMHVSGGSWTEDPEQATYTAVDDQPLEIDVPTGEARTLTFNAGPDEGVAEIVIGDESLEFDLNNESVVELGLPHPLPASGHRTIPAFVWPLAAAVIFLLLCLTGGAPKQAGRCRRLERNRSVDGLRGILAVIIALFHFGQVYEVWNVFHHGWFAVEVFFLISGFLLADKLESGEEGISLSKTVYRRLCHLYPAYFVSIIAVVMFFSAMWFNWDPFAWMRSDNGYTAPLVTELLCAQVTGVSGFRYINYPLWYVSALLLSTIIITSIWQVFPRKVSKASLAVSAFVIYGVLFIYDPGMSTAGYITGTRLPSPLLRGIAGMGLGCCLYWAYQRFYERAKQISWLNIVSVGTCVVMLCLIIFSGSNRVDFLVLILASIVILTMFWLGEKGKFPILNSRPVQYLGRVSYTFYVMQAFSQNFVSNCIAPHISNHLLLNVIYITLNLLLSAALYPVLERYLPGKLMKAPVKKGPEVSP